MSDSPSTPAPHAAGEALALRVMRLSKPSFDTSFPACHAGTSQWDLARPSFPAVRAGGDNASAEMAEGVALSRELAMNSLATTDVGTSATLLLPRSFGSIFLGESFACFLSVTNVSGAEALQVSARAELQTTTQKHAVLDGKAEPLLKLSPGESHDFVVEHEVTELGVHILVCTVTYLTPHGQSQSFRKFFKFQVTNPLHFRTNIHDLQHGVFVTALVQNACPIPLFFESVEFLPSDLFAFKDCNQPDAHASGDRRSPEQTTHSDNTLDRTSADDGVRGVPQPASIQDVVFLKTNDVQQYLFQLTPKDLRNPATRAARELGKIDIVWRSQLGSRGRLQTAPLERRLQQSAEVELMLYDLPSHVTLEVPFQVKGAITNRSQRVMRLSVSFAPRSEAVSDAGISVSHGIAHAGLSGFSLGVVKPDETIDFPLSLFPLKPGVQRLAGVRVIDQDARPSKVFDFREILELFVF